MVAAQNLHLAFGLKFIVYMKFGLEYNKHIYILLTLLHVVRLRYCKSF